MYGAFQASKSRDNLEGHNSTGSISIRVRRLRLPSKDLNSMPFNLLKFKSTPVEMQKIYSRVLQPFLPQIYHEFQNIKNI